MKKILILLILTGILLISGVFTSLILGEIIQISRVNEKLIFFQVFIEIIIFFIILFFLNLFFIKIKEYKIQKFKNIKYQEIY